MNLSPDVMGRSATTTYGVGGDRNTGTVIGYCDAPQVLIEYPDGTREWWRADLTRLNDVTHPA